MTNFGTYPSLCGSVAGSASHLGVALHNAGYEELNLDLRYVAVGTDDLERAIKGFSSLGFLGFAVSMPFKSEIIKHLDEISEDVSSIGACNTVVNADGKLKGYNTDWRGSIDALNEIGAKEIEKAVIVGAGGAARAIAYGLKAQGAKVWIAARDLNKSKMLVDDLGLEGNLELSDQGQVNAELIVNATPVSEAFDGPLKLEAHSNARFLLDVVFTPKETKLAALARQKGLAVAPGWRMLLHQALHQFKLYTGKDAPEKKMATVLEEALS